MKAPIWVARDGVEIPLSEMKDSHLLNAHRFVVNKAVEYREMENFITSPFAPSEDTMAYDDMMDCFWDSMDTMIACEHWIPIFAEEINKRGLTPLKAKEVRALPTVESVEYYHGARIMKLKQ